MDSRFIKRTVLIIQLLAIVTAADAQTNHTILWKAPATGTSIIVAPGDTVTWVWDDALPHTVTSSTALFDSGSHTGLGFKYSRVFPSLGNYDYLCLIHGSASMSGTISVLEPLPVELTAFEAIVVKSDVLLSWTTASEKDNAGFHVQLGVDEDDWTDLGFVPGKGSAASEQSYTYRVSGLLPGDHRFRLKQVDIDGTVEFSGVVEASIEVPGSHLISAAYPNPLTAESNYLARVEISVATSQNVDITVYSVDGRLVEKVFEGQLEPGRTRPFHLDAADWPSGSYVVSFRGDRFEDVRSLQVLR